MEGGVLKELPATSRTATQAVVERETSGIGFIKLDVDPVVGPKGFTPEAKVALERTISGSLRVIPSGVGKVALLNDTTGELFLMLNALRDPWSRYLQKQVEFYIQYDNHPLFQELVVPLTKVIMDKQDLVVGMAQPHFGISVSEYKSKGRRVSKEEIDKFVNNYQQFIEKTKVAHGDLVHGQLKGHWLSAEWDHMRIDPQTGKLRFIDYNGKDGQINADYIYKPTGSPQEVAEYERVRDEDPGLLKEALLKLFEYRGPVKETVKGSWWKGVLHGREKAA